MSKIIERIKEAEKHGIYITDALKVTGDIRGIYGIFSLINDKKTCLYIGRSYNVLDRLFGSSGHISKYIYNNCKGKNLISKLINDAKQGNCNILIDLIKEVKYKGDNYYRDMHRLVYEEYKSIEDYQKKGECLYQLPEGKWMSKEKWEKEVKKL